MENQIGLSKGTIIKDKQELNDIFLVEEKKQGFNKPNKIYLMSPVIRNDEPPDLYLDPESDYDPEIMPDYGCDSEHIENDTSGNTNSVPPLQQELNLRTSKNYTNGSIEIEPPKVQELNPNDNKLIKNKKNNNNFNNNELSDTATANSGEADNAPPAAAEAEKTPYSQILEMYNELCEIKGLRSIRSINGKRKTQTAARFNEYGLGGFVELFEKVSASLFLCGGSQRGWKADFDWLIAPTNMQKVLEGKYENDQSNVPIQQTYTYEPYQAGFSNPPQNKQERRDPFLERAMMAYETAVQSAET
jgi:hypothetical protein